MVKRHAEELARPFVCHSWPAVECPECERGAMLLVDNGETGKVPSVHVEYRWNPDEADSPFDIKGTFVAHLRCSHCGFVVGVTGEMFVGDNPDYRSWDSDSTVDEAFYRVRNIFPPLLIAEHSEDVPTEVAMQLRRAGALIWSDASAAMTAMRTAVEVLLTAQGIPSNTNSGGPMTLDRRIKIFHTQQPELAILLHANRVAGNQETHGDSTNATIEHVLEIVEHFEMVLSALYARDRAAAYARAREIVANKGF